MRDRVTHRTARRTLRLPADPRSVAAARRYFEGIADDTDLPAEVRDAGVLAVSELVTNAVVHGREPIVLRVTTQPRAVRVSVSDGSNRPPRPRRRARTRPASTDRCSDDHGRGLTIVERVVQQWGCTPSVQQSGKTVWCNLSVARPAT